MASCGSTADGRAPSEQLGIGGTLGSPGCLFVTSGNGTRTIRLAGHTQLEPKSWHHVVWVRDGERVRVYLDGEPEPEIDGTVDAASAVTAADWLFAGRADGFANLEGKTNPLRRSMIA